MFTSLGTATTGTAAPEGRVSIDTAAVLDSLHMQIALLDAAGTIVSVNDAWQRFGIDNGGEDQGFGVGSNYLAHCAQACQALSHSQVMPPSPGASNPAAEAASASAGIAAVLSGALPRFEFEYGCDSPQVQRRFLMRVTPLVGPVGGAVVTHDDITQRWRLGQQRTELIAELLTANRELSEFAYVVSHDLKAPLRGISSLASWLIADHAEQLGAEGQQHLHMIASRVKRLAGLIDAILAYSRAGRAREPRGPVALTPLLNNVVDLLLPPAHVRVHIADDLPEVNVDAAKIQQVFQNLLANAIDFMDKPSGEISVSCRREPTHWHFLVADNGAGIAPKHFERIFQLFQTLAARDERERTGVGLALVKKIIELEGGQVWVESELGVGSTFHLTLPLAAPTAHPGQA